MIKYTGTANAAVMGMVSTQERKISFNTSHLTLDNLSPARTHDGHTHYLCGAYRPA